MRRDLAQLYVEACGGRQDALAFLMAFHCYAHMLDDLVDEGCDAERLMAAAVMANDMYSTPFWICNSANLSGVIRVIANSYADSVAMAQRAEPWKRAVADVIRSSGNDMVVAVAQLVGGWQHGRRVSERIRELSNEDQRKE